MEREIALDTETTGLSPEQGHRIVEIGCVEMFNRLPTGKIFHQYLNPERDMPQEAFDVHGLSDEFLSDKPKFAEVADAFLAFVGDAKLVIHNAQFDMRFINAELTHIKKRNIRMDQVLCTLVEARKRFPGAPASLDALCKRFEIDNSSRTKHGALLDAELLAEMYLELMGGRQDGFNLAQTSEEKAAEIASIQREPLEARPHQASKDELEAHQAFIKKLEDALWEA